MSSHRSRMQYEHQRQTGAFARIDSQSSLRSDDPINSSSHGTNLRLQEAGGSQLSGSYQSSRSRIQLGGAAAAVARAYENLPGRPVDVSQRSSSTGINAISRGRSDRLYRPPSMTSYPASVVPGRSAMTEKSWYTTSQLRLSRSLKASKASLATYKSGRTTIQAEHHDRKVQREINSVKFGRARKLYWIAVACYIMFLVVLFLGLLITCLRFIYMNIILSLDVGEMTGPVLIAGSFLFFGLGMKFYYDAYKLGCEERTRVKYKAASPSTVAVTTVSEKVPDAQEELISGQTSKNALSRAPIGSRNTLLVP